MLNSLPAALGGTPMFESDTPMARPTLAVDEALSQALWKVMISGQLTNGPEVAAFEREVADFVGVEHAVAVSNCTTGLLLVLRCLGLTGDVVLPSFTFIATGHVVLWNGLTPVFADVGTDTFTLDPNRAEAALGENTSAILGVHTFGAPCDVDALEKTAESRGVPLVIDAAHGFGGVYEDGSHVGSRGTAEVFSLSPTKPFTAGEGGIITTNDGSLARDLRAARNYGNPGTYDSVLLGLNGRLTEFSAVIGRHGLPPLPDWLDRRRLLAHRYRENLRELPGISFQRVRDGTRSVYKDLCVLVEGDGFGLRRDQVSRALASEGIPTRRYFDPPLHRQAVYRTFAGSSADQLKVTDRLAGQVLVLPFYSHMPESIVDHVCHAIHRIHGHAAAIGDAPSERTQDNDAMK